MFNKITDRTRLYWHGCRDNFSKGECYQYGIDKRQIAALCVQGIKVPKNIKLAEQFILRASNAGSIEAKFQLGQLYQVEHPGVGKNLEKSFEYYMQAAKAGKQSSSVR